MNLKPFIILVASIALWACTPTPEVKKLSGEAQGTTYHISFWSEKPSDTAAIDKLIKDELARLDVEISNYRPDSRIEKFNATDSSEPLETTPEIIGLIETARMVSEASEGCYDLTIKPLFDLWGFKTDKLNIPSKETLQATLQQVGFKQINIMDATHIQKLNPKLRIDLSSIAQGYSVGRIVSLLEQQGINNYLVEIGGELQTRGKKPDGNAWRVAIEKPISSERTMHKVLTIQRTEPLAVMTSGTYRHYFDKDGKRYSHILDAKTGSPVDHTTVSVTVLHDNPTLADAWSTAMLCLGKQRGLDVANKASIAVLFIEQQGEVFDEVKSGALEGLKDITIE
jgi:FAD:protein FMN transferase